MKELELIYANNVRIAKKLEEFGLFKEADITDDLNLFILVDTADEAVQYIDDFYKSHQLTPNF